MEFVIDLSGIPTNSPIIFGWWFFKTIGWIYPVFLFLYGLVLAWQNYIRNIYRKTREYIVLAIDIPKNNEQAPRAVENIFAHIAGAHQPLTAYHNWWTGEIKDSFSFEIISIGGYIQFLIHLKKEYRDLIEAVIYAQYPDAEITEVEDYTKKWNIKFPNDTYQLHGTEIKLAKDEIYPIITYTEFEDSLSGELKDPMASLLEALSRINKGEEIWVQFVLTPADNDWGNRAETTINKLIGAKNTGGKKNLADKIFELPNQVIDAMKPLNPDKKSDDGGPPNMILYMTEGQKNDIKAIGRKTSKIGFHTKIRFIYLAEHSVFNKQRGNQVIYGAFKQFNDLGLNSFKPDKRIYTGAIITFKKIRLKWRRNKIMARYKDRAQSLSPGEYGYILNTEELATLWHFPMMTVKTPLLKKAEAKKSEPPMSLPVENEKIELKSVDDSNEKSLANKSNPPSNLPIG